MIERVEDAPLAMITPSELSDLLAPHQKDRPLWIRALCVAGAVVCFLLGIVGWLIPVITGIPFYVVGLALLGMASSRVIVWINRLERRLPDRFRRELRRALFKIPQRIRRHLRLREDIVRGS